MGDYKFLVSDKVKATCDETGRVYQAGKGTPYPVTCEGFCRCMMPRFDRPIVNGKEVPEPDRDKWGNGNCHKFKKADTLAKNLPACMEWCESLTDVKFCCQAYRCTWAMPGETDLRDWYGTRFDVQGYKTGLAKPKCEASHHDKCSQAFEGGKCETSPSWTSCP
jgi:hypothetical protein